MSKEVEMECIISFLSISKITPVLFHIMVVQPKYLSQCHIFTYINFVCKGEIPREKKRGPSLAMIVWLLDLKLTYAISAYHH